MIRRTGFAGVLRWIKPASSTTSSIQNEEQLSQARSLSDAARLEEQDGFPFTAAIKWREAAELSGEDPIFAEQCWGEWERLMGLPRQLIWQALNKQAA